MMGRNHFHPLPIMPWTATTAAIQSPDPGSNSIPSHYHKTGPAPQLFLFKQVGFVLV